VLSLHGFGSVQLHIGAASLVRVDKFHLEGAIRVVADHVYVGGLLLRDIHRNNDCFCGQTAGDLRAAGHAVSDPECALAAAPHADLNGAAHAVLSGFDDCVVGLELLQHETHFDVPPDDTHGVCRPLL